MLHCNYGTNGFQEVGYQENYQFIRGDKYNHIEPVQFASNNTIWFSREYLQIVVKNEYDMMFFQIYSNRH